MKVSVRGMLCTFLLFCGSFLPTKADARNYQHAVTGGIRTLQTWYSKQTGLYTSTGWWNSANAISAMVNAMRVSGSTKYIPVVANTFVAAQRTTAGFLNDYYDDEGWWALAWIDAYDLTKEPRYLSMAESILADMAGGWDDGVCGGGIWWSKKRTYKNAIANELFLSVAAHLANRASDPLEKARYLMWAQREWRWFDASGMRNSQNLINDGLNSKNPSACVNNGQTAWSYNQGVVLGGLVELSKADGDTGLLTVAHSIADAALLHLTDAHGILHDVCEPRCGGDGVQFKGIFVRNLMALDEASPRSQYKAFMEANANSILAHAQGRHHQFGQVWSGPFDGANAGTQSSALDALVAAVEAAGAKNR
jgi:predicted alpha-1,6-mannanase (GH76 family)